MNIEIKIPDIAENVDSGIIANILVVEGNEVTVDQPLVEIETDKATTDIPSPFEGIIKKILVKEGEEVKVHQVIMIIEVSENKEAHDEKIKTDGNKDHHNTQLINEDLLSEEQGKDDIKKNSLYNHQDDLNSIPASPLARKIAREHSVDITKLEGTGPRQRITRHDVENYINQKSRTIETREKNAEETTIERENVTYKPMSNIRKIIAKNMQESWQTIPHVTQFDESDITLIEEFRKVNMEEIAMDGGKLTITALLVKIAGFALQRFLKFNASIDMSDMQVIYKDYFNINIAVDTPKGLLVPVIKNVDRKSLSEISVEITDLSNKARDNKISINELTGGSFTISNLGGIGGTNFTPIIYQPQVAILGVSRAKIQQVFIENDFKKRLILPLSLSYDHRLIDGAEGARFLRWICNALENPFGIMK